MCLNCSKSSNINCAAHPAKSIQKALNNLVILLIFYRIEYRLYLNLLSTNKFQSPFLETFQWPVNV